MHWVRYVLIQAIAIFALWSDRVIVVPDYAPYASTIFPARPVTDYQGAPLWGKIQYLLTQKGYTVSAVTDSNLPKKLQKNDRLVCWSDALTMEQLQQYSSSNLIILMFQPPTVAIDSYAASYLARFSKIITWYDDWVGGVNVYKFHYGVWYPMIPNTVPFSERKFCCAMASNKTSTYIDELYSTRLSMIQYFNQNHPDQFDLYGLYWDGEGLSVYQGWVDDKIQTLKNYKFSICFENTKNFSGYITEKIFDCFQAGVVPVYFGAPNIAREVPSNCFIDWRDFSSYDELYRYLQAITEDQFNAYLKNISAFLNTSQAQTYSPDHAANEIVNGITASYSIDSDELLVR